MFPLLRYTQITEIISSIPLYIESRQLLCRFLFNGIHTGTDTEGVRKISSRSIYLSFFMYMQHQLNNFSVVQTNPPLDLYILNFYPYFRLSFKITDTILFPSVPGIIKRRLHTARNILINEITRVE